MKREPDDNIDGVLASILTLSRRSKQSQGYVVIFLESLPTYLIEGSILQ